MKNYRLLSEKSLVGFIILLACLFSGCQTSDPVTRKKAAAKREAPVFYPGAPDKPRIQFLTSLSVFQQADKIKASEFDAFLFGKPQAGKEGIVKPYGIALFEEKLYVCDVGRKVVKVIDLKTNIMTYLSRDRRMLNPVNIFIEADGTKYVADPKAGAVFVFSKIGRLSAILAEELKIQPVDVEVFGDNCYVADTNAHRVVVFNKKSGEEIMRMGKYGNGDGEFKLISDLTVDGDGNIYVTDKALAKITIFNKEGIFQKTIGDIGTNVGLFGRPKGLALDHENRIWVVDAASDVGKIYTTKPEFLLYFGLSLAGPGTLDMPAGIILDYDHIEMFRKYAVPGAEIEFLVLISNQFGPSKINIYAFGNFPGYGKGSEKTP
jgi:DNA-binding beta-propeller fold protein YncE